MSSRNQNGLTEKQIEKCLLAWEQLGGNEYCILDTSEASAHNSCTRFDQIKQMVYLGADVMPGKGTEARSRMSMLACLAHELAHFERYKKGYDRPTNKPDMLLDEAEASLDASFNPTISQKDRVDLVEDAQDQIVSWLQRIRQ